MVTFLDSKSICSQQIHSESKTCNFTYIMSMVKTTTNQKGDTSSYNMKESQNGDRPKRWQVMSSELCCWRIDTMFRFGRISHFEMRLVTDDNTWHENYSSYKTCRSPIILYHLGLLHVVSRHVSAHTSAASLTWSVCCRCCARTGCWFSSINWTVHLCTLLVKSAVTRCFWIFK